MTTFYFLADQAAAAGPASALGSFLPLFLIFGIFYFLLIRPQKKQQKLHQKMISDTKAGDEIITSSGLHGKVVDVSPEIVTVQIARDVTIKLEKSHIQTIKGYATPKAA